MASQAFPSAHRLLNGSEFKAVFNNVRVRASSRHALALVRPNTLDHDRLGIVVAKKNVRQAVQRNRIKRQIREYFRQHTLPIHCDVIVLARHKMDDLENPQIHALLDKLWDTIATKTQSVK